MVSQRLSNPMHISNIDTRISQERKYYVTLKCEIFAVNRLLLMHFRSAQLLEFHESLLALIIGEIFFFSF